MTQAAAAAFASVADLCLEYAANAQRNLKILKGNSPIGDKFHNFKKTDTDHYQSLLCYETAGTKYFRVLGGLIVKTKKFKPFGLSESYATHCDIVHANAVILYGREKVQFQEELAPALGQDFDRILWRSRALAAAFRHASRVEAEPDVGLAIIQTGKIVTKAGPLPKESLAAADLMLKDLLVIYRRQLAAIPTDIRDVAWNIAALRQALAATPFNPLPVWIGYKEHAGSKVLNGIWMPQQYADPVVKELAAKQAEAASQVPHQRQ